MPLNNKEKKYIEKVVNSDSDLDIEIMIEVMNKKRKDDELIDIEDVVNFIDTIDQSPDGHQVKKNVDKKENRHQKRAKALKQGKELDEKAVYTAYIAAKVIEDLNPVLENLLKPPKPKEYIIIDGKGIAYLEQEVKKAIKLGWQPLGGVSAAAFGMSPVGGNKYIQAMVKY